MGKAEKTKTRFTFSYYEKQKHSLQVVTRDHEQTLLHPNGSQVNKVTNK